MLVSGYLSLPGQDHSDNLTLYILCGLRILPGNSHCSDTWQSPPELPESYKWSSYSSWSHTHRVTACWSTPASQDATNSSPPATMTHILLPKCVNKIKNFRNCLQSQQCLPDKHMRCKWKPSIFVHTLMPFLLENHITTSFCSIPSFKLEYFLNLVLFLS